MIKDLIKEEDIWARHSNPKSGWSRIVAGFVIVGTLYHRKWKVLGLAVLFLIINPVLFRKPSEDLDDWMYKVVRAEERWTNDGNSLIGLGYPEILNTVSIPVGLYGLYAAYKQKPISTVVFTLASQGLNQWCMKEIIEYYEEVNTQ
ncbi:DUF6653 family protein [Haladaptatus pallidirubidus]|uniref:Uncharacterized protein n=1 Tax=Haladaptatus pallidirubidus TaxID=1008152 RepID=A0AAV3UHK1_9EURY|nr:DUF6653 family protein [Haladaptatus pallidirubidus]